MVFGYYASAIGRAFFPNQSEFVSLMLSLMTFGAGFLMRPSGCHRARRLHRSTRPPRRTHSDARADVGRNLLDRVHARIRRYWIRGPAAGVVGRLLQGFSPGVELGGVAFIWRRSPRRATRDSMSVGNPAASKSPSCSRRSSGSRASPCLPPEQMPALGMARAAAPRLRASSRSCSCFGGRCKRRRVSAAQSTGRRRGNSGAPWPPTGASSSSARCWSR